MSNLKSKIDANDQTLLQVLDNQKYSVDYYQREYSWKKKHVDQLITDLTSSFLSDYKVHHEKGDVRDYNSYYLGPFVLSEKRGFRSIIDGQQRLTTLTLFLIYLNNLGKRLSLNLKIEDMIFSDEYGDKSYNILVEERINCLNGLFNQGSYQASNSDDESTHNMAVRYEDIEESFPKEIDLKELPLFIEWLKRKVILVEIVAYSDDNAYTIFETMNDRGLNLTSTEMLKGFVLSRFKDNDERQKANDYWKSAMQELHEFDKDEDLSFFQSWLRGKYALSIRPAAAGSKNEDFEKVGTRFHAWFRENLDLIDLSSESESLFRLFLYEDMKFFKDAYISIRKAENQLITLLEHVYYIKRWGIAASLSYPLMLAPLIKSDSFDLVQKKMNLVAKYIETFAVRRSVNFKKFSASSIKYTMYSLVKEIRNLSLDELRDVLADKINEMDQKWSGFDSFRLHGQNKRFIKFLLSRISAFVDKESGGNETFETYYTPSGKAFEVEHIWADKFENHMDEFDQKNDFDEYRNRLGALVLLPNGSNQSYGSKPYSEKLKHYVKENLLVKSLCEIAYQNNPNFLKMIEKHNLTFIPHPQFMKADILKRQGLYREICEIIWNF